MATCRIVTIHKAHPKLKIDRRRLTAAVNCLDQHAKEFRGGCPPGELSLAFLTDEMLAEIHGRFLDDPTRTDVITFEGDPALSSAGEVCVSVDTARAYAKTHKADFAEELTLYVVHGWLHLAGYDDLRPAKKRVMRAAEKLAMKLLLNANILPIFV